MGRQASDGSRAEAFGFLLLTAVAALYMEVYHFFHLLIVAATATT